MSATASTCNQQPFSLPINLHINQPTNKQTNKQTNQQTNKQINKQTIISMLYVLLHKIAELHNCYLHCLYAHATILYMSSKCIQMTLMEAKCCNKDNISTHPSYFAVGNVSDKNVVQLNITYCT